MPAVENSVFERVYVSFLSTLFFFHILEEKIRACKRCEQRTGLCRQKSHWNIDHFLDYDKQKQIFDSLPTPCLLHLLNLQTINGYGNFITRAKDVIQMMIEKPCFLDWTYVHEMRHRISIGIRGIFEALLREHDNSLGLYVRSLMTEPDLKDNVTHILQEPNKWRLWKIYQMSMSALYDARLEEIRNNKKARTVVNID